MFVAWVLLGLGLAGGGQPAEAVEVVAAEYRADTPFPEFLPLWLEGWARLHAAGESLESIQNKNPLGGNVHLYLRNPSDHPLDVSDLAMDGVSLARGIAFSREAGHRGLHAASIHFSELPDAERNRLIEAGEPVWWKVDPQPVPPKGFAEVVIRLRRNPRAAAVAIQVCAGTTKTEARVNVGKSNPRIAGAAFSPALDAVTLYLRHPRQEATPPTRCRMDGTDVTEHVTLRPGGHSDTLPIIVRPPRPLETGAFHFFQVEYGDGSTAQAGIRAWADELVYGMWGYTNAGRTPEENAKTCLTDLSRHTINVHMGMGGDWGPFIDSQAGQDFLETLGMRMVVKEPGSTRKPVYCFLMDEPDANDYFASQLPAPQRLGTLAQALVRHSAALRQRDPATPHLLNVNNTYKPENWYTYGQLPDVLATDPYYQEQLAKVYGARPGWLASFVKPTFVYATAVVCRSAAEPRPVHVILNAVRHDHSEQPFRFATPAEKRIELYYALAGGARGFSYWWYAPYDQYYGVGGSGPEAAALWREIGLLGAEVRTAGSVITRSCPATVPVKAPPRLWVRTLLAGLDTLVVVVVNDNFAVDRSGTVIYPVEKASVTVGLPAWLVPKAAFEVTYAGTRIVPWTASGNQVTLDLGTVEVTRLVFISAEAELQDELEEAYRTRFAANVKELLRSQETHAEQTPGSGDGHTE